MPFCAMTAPNATADFKLFAAKTVGLGFTIVALFVRARRLFAGISSLLLVFVDKPQKKNQI